jgi:hypothetical protein
MASFLENIFGGGYDPNESATTSLNQANSEANATDATGATVQGVDNISMTPNVDLGGNGAASTAAASDAAVAAGGARSSAEGAAQAAGLSGAAAANAGAGAGASTYGSTYSSVQPQLANTEATERGQTISSNTTQRGQTLGANEATAENQTSASIANTNAQATERGQNLGYAQGMAGVGASNAQNIGNAEGSLLSAGATLLSSDKNQKVNFEDYGDLLDSVAKNIKGYKYNYKESSGENPNHEEIGITAQDLEKTPLKSAVMNTSSGKQIDTRRLTTANTAMISDLSRKLDKALEYIGKVK